jgi:hypothetical protein
METEGGCEDNGPLVGAIAGIVSEIAPTGIGPARSPMTPAPVPETSIQMLTGNPGVAEHLRVTELLLWPLS